MYHALREFGVTGYEGPLGRERFESSALRCMRMHDGSGRHFDGTEMEGLVRSVTGGQQKRPAALRHLCV